MKNAAVVNRLKTGRPFVETDFLMTDFDKFYKGVVGRQLTKDKLSVKKKYANCTAFGEGEKHILPSEPRDGNLSSRISNDPIMFNKTNQISSLSSIKNRSSHLIAPQKFLLSKTDLSMLNSNFVTSNRQQEMSSA